MRIDFIMVMGVFVNLMMAVMFPAQVLGADPFGLTDKVSQDLDNPYFNQQYRDQVDQSGFGNKNSEKVASSVNTGSQSQIANPNEGSFIDWIFAGFKYLKTALLFFVPFISFIWLLYAPLNYILGIFFTVIYIFTFAKFIMGR